MAVFLRQRKLTSPPAHLLEHTVRVVSLLLLNLVIEEGLVVEERLLAYFCEGEKRWFVILTGIYPCSDALYLQLQILINLVLIGKKWF